VAVSNRNPELLLRLADWPQWISGFTWHCGHRACAVGRSALSLAPRRKEDGGCQDAIVCVVGFTPECLLQRRVLAVFPHRRDGEEVFHRGDPGRDDDHR